MAKTIKRKPKLNRKPKKENRDKQQINNYLKKIFSKTPITKLSSLQTKILFTHIEKIIRANIRDKNLNIPNPQKQGWQSKGITAYRNRGINVEAEVNDLLKKKRKAKVLDIGSGNSEMLFELKLEFGDKIETHALDFNSLQKYTTDYTHTGIAEILPKNFREKFDLIVSRETLKFSIYPDISLRNIVESLAKGGKAVVQYSYYIPTNLLPSQKLENLKRKGIKALNQDQEQIVRREREQFLERKNNAFLKELEKISKDRRFIVMQLGNSERPEVIQIIRK